MTLDYEALEDARADFERWLARFAAGDIVGIRGDGERCVLANWLRDEYGVEALVAGSIYDTATSKRLANCPDWANYALECFELGGDEDEPCTAAEMRAWYRPPEALAGE